MFQATLFRFLFPSFLVGGLTIFGSRRMLARGVWGLVLSLCGGGRGLVGNADSSI